MSIISFHDPARRPPSLNPTQRDQLAIYSIIKEVINVEKTDIPTLITSYLFSCNEEMALFLEQVNWDTTTFCQNRPLAPYFLSFKHQITSLPNLPFAFKTPESKQLIDRTKAVVYASLNLDSVSVSMQVHDVPKWDDKIGITDNPLYDPKTTEELYEWIMNNRGIKEVKAEFPISLNLLKILTSKPLKSFSFIKPSYFPKMAIQVGPRVTDCVIRLTQLTSLTLRGWRLTSELVKQISLSCPLLKELDLSKNEITQLDFSLPHLQILDINDNWLTEEQTFNALRDSPKLLAINFNACVSAENAPSFINTVCDLPELRSLQMMHCPITEDELSRIFKIKNLCFLEFGVFMGSYALGSTSNSLSEQRPSVNLRHIYSDIELPSSDGLA